MSSQEIVLYGFPLSVLVLGIVAVARYVGMPSLWAPPLSLVLGILGGEAAQAHVLQTGGPPDWIFGAISGIALGLVASGIFSHAQVYVSTGTIPRSSPVPEPEPPVVVPPA